MVMSRRQDFEIIQIVANGTIYERGLVAENVVVNVSREVGFLAVRLKEHLLALPPVFIDQPATFVVKTPATW